MIEMKTDTFIEIGSQHKICEDYMISGDNYIILADGCSSSENSEMGARFLCYMAKRFLSDHRERKFNESFATGLGDWVIYNSETLIRQLGLRKTCLDATLVVAYLKDNFVNIIMYGDGHIILQPEIESKYEIISVDYKSGSKSMPYYLRYIIDSQGRTMYHKAKVTKTISIDTIDQYSGVHHPISWELAYDIPLINSYPIDDYKSISICSDGFGTFLTPEPDETGNKIIKVENMVPAIFEFRNSTGVFLKRQMNLLQRRLRKADTPMEHFDDLSIGTFLKEETPDADQSESK
jgi:hypothetical protein